MPRGAGRKHPEESKVHLILPSPHAENQDCFQLFISYEHSDVSFMKNGFPKAFEIWILEKRL